MSADKSGSPPCGIYVRIDDFSNMLDVIGYIRQMAFTINQRSGYEKNMSIIEVGYTKKYAERAKDIIPIIKDQGLVAIIHGSSDPLGADGILLDNSDNLPMMRKALGDDAIIGVIGDKDTTLADYVVLNADPAIIAKWKAENEALCVARGKKPLTADSSGALVSAGADFIDVSTYILKHKKGIMQGTVNILHEINQAVKPPKTVN